MGKTVTITLRQQAAVSLFRWYLGLENPDQVSEHIYRWISSYAESSPPLSNRDITQYLNRIRNHPDFTKKRDALLGRWRDEIDACNGKPDLAFAERFLNDWLGHRDHSLLFSQSLVAGVTRIRADEFGDTTTFLYDSRRFWTLHLTLEGAAIYTSDHDFEARQGDILLIEPGARCHYRRTPEAGYWSHAWAVFQARDSWTQWLRWPSPAQGVQRLLLSDTLLEEVKPLLAQVRHLSRDDGHLSTELGLNLLEQLLIRIARAAPQGHQQLPDSRVQRAREYLRRHIADPITVEDVAEHCHISPSRIAHLFKQDLGISLQQYRNHLRMLEARQLLLSSDLRVDAIAHRIGYGDPAQFSKSFRKYNGCSPRQFRSKHAREPS